MRPTGTMKNQTFKALFANKNFMKLWISQMLSQFSIQIMNFYVLTRIFSRTQSTIAVSLIWIASALPALLFGPFSGVIVDSFSRRKMLVATNILQALTIALLLLPARGIFHYYVIVFLYWLFDQAYFPSQQASASQLVDKKSLVLANTLFTFTQQFSILIGFGLGGILLSIFGPTPTVVVATINLLLAAVAVKFLPYDVPPTKFADKNLFRFWADLQAGYKFIRTHTLVWMPLLMIVFTQVFIAIISTTIPSYTHDVLQWDLNKAGVILIIPGVLGAILTMAYIPKIITKYRKKVLIELGVLVGGVALIAMFVISFLPVFKTLPAMLIAVGLGACTALVLAPSQALLQERTPPWFQGRVYGHMGFLLIVTTILPLLFAGTIADSFGIATLMGIMGMIMLIFYWFIKERGDHVLANGFGF